MGGMGLRSAETNCSVAYVTSQILTEHMVAGLLGLDEVELETEEAMVHLDYLLGEERPQLLSEDSLGGETQCTLSHKMDEFIQSQLFENVTEPREKARVLSVRLPHSGD